ncbi:MAG TPA: MarR family transcriptional regulator [Paenibacillus sp.]|jgi:DNA-binding MarR family transcriptional regulator
MDIESNQGNQLLEAISKFKRLHTRAITDERVPRGEFVLMNVISKMMHKHALDSEGDDKPGIKVSELSNKMKISPPSVSQMVNSLEEKGLVERLTTRNDRRVVYVNLTEEGRSILKQTTDHFLTFSNEIARRLGHEETDHLIRLFNRLNTIVGEMQEEQR